MPMVWTEAAVAKLFLGVLATSDVKVDHKALATYMGPECTVEAIKQKLRRMKAAEKNEEAGNKLAASGGSGPSASPATSGKVSKVPKNKGSAKRKEMSFDEEGQGGEDLNPKPSKLPKKSKLGATSSVGYHEVVNDDEDEDTFDSILGGKLEDDEEV